MTPVIIESPFRGERGDYAAAALYLNYCIRDCCLRRKETPYASHRMLTSALRDEVPEERALGIAAGLEMARVICSVDGARVAVYEDIGVSEGMTRARKFHRGNGMQIFTRALTDSDFSDYQRELAKLRAEPEPVVTGTLSVGASE